VSESLLRSAPFTLARDAADGDGSGDGNTLEGYAAVFDSPTRIDSWEGTFDETIARGAFKKSIRENTPVLQFDHGRHPMVGSIPLGALDTVREDAQGLYVKAALHDNWLVQPVRDAIASQAIDGMSFRFQVVKDEWRDAKGNVLTDPTTSSACCTRRTSAASSSAR
jgi:HK97 family phage prohead protease